MNNVPTFVGIFSGSPRRCYRNPRYMDLPIVIEIVDTEENIKRLLPFLDETVKEGLITMERVRVIRYVADEG